MWNKGVWYSHSKKKVIYRDKIIFWIKKNRYFHIPYQTKTIAWTNGVYNFFFPFSLPSNFHAFLNVYPLSLHILCTYINRWSPQFPCLFHGKTPFCNQLEINEVENLTFIIQFLNVDTIVINIIFCMQPTFGVYILSLFVLSTLLLLLLNTLLEYYMLQCLRFSLSLLESQKIQNSLDWWMQINGFCADIYKQEGFNSLDYMYIIMCLMNIV